MASLDDILTASKNIVTALSRLGQTFLDVQGSSSYTNITTATLVQSGQGRIARVVVVVAGSGAGAVYDAASATATSDKLLTIPTTVGVVEANIPVNNGIVVAPGAGQTVAIIYS
jgi:N-methylhydantoinase B/oxoprolinase/acetone carboxylase alpha subunit